MPENRFSQLEKVFAYDHLRWEMPVVPENGLTEPLAFEIITTRIPLSDLARFAAGLRSFLSERNILILTTAAANLLAGEGVLQRKPSQPHLIAFVSAPTERTELLQAGALILFRGLQERHPDATISMIPLHMAEYRKIEAVATKFGMQAGPRPSSN